ncbi:lysylphosphatidylglycerol synthase transmembrane domain-containing protein [Rhodocyclaceae bacterium SMB388]
MKKLLAIAFSLALLAWLVSDGRGRDLIDMLRRLTPSMIVIALGGLFVSYLLRAMRVYDEFRVNAGGRFGHCLRIVLIHNAMVNVVPFRGGEAAFPLLLRQTFGTPLGRALASLFWFRLQDVFVVAVIATLVWPGLPPVLRMVGVTGLICLAWYLPRWANGPALVATGSANAGRLARLRQAFAESTRHARFGWLWTLANWTVKLAVQAWLLAELLNVALPVGMAGTLGAELAAILPVQGVAGFGTYEAGAAAALLPHGVGLEQGLKAALVLHLVVIASAVSAGAIAWLIPVDEPGIRH